MNEAKCHIHDTDAGFLNVCPRFLVKGRQGRKRISCFFVDQNLFRLKLFGIFSDECVFP